MRRSLLLGAASGGLLAVVGGLLLGGLLAACGGSSSETPWPAPPETPTLGPAGEVDRAPPVPTSQTDAGAPKAQPE